MKRFILLVMALFSCVIESAPVRSTPLGVLNSYGVCYAASVIQLFEALRHAAPREMEKILAQNTDPLVTGYAAALDDVTRFGGFSFKPLINPKLFVEAWVQLYEKQYAHVLLERVMQPDGTVQDRELKPYLVHRGTGGDPTYMAEVLIRRMKSGVASTVSTEIVPHTLVLDTFECVAADKNRSDLLCESLFASIPFQQYQPRFVMIFIRGKDAIFDQAISLKPPLRIECAGYTYRLLGAIYSLPVFSIHFADLLSRSYSFDEMHGIAVVRYNDKWFECDNHQSKSFADEAAVAAWIDLKSRTSYHGLGIPDGVKAIVPRVILYEQIAGS